MLFKKTFVGTILMTIGLSTPLLANAGDLIVSNYTKRDSTSIINRGACSTILGEIGVTRAGHTNVIPESKVKFACMLNPSNCQADVYMTANCMGPIIATVFFNVNLGISAVQMKDPSYAIVGSGFTVALYGGPAIISEK